MRTMIGGGLTALVLLLGASPALACSSEPYIGDTCTTAAPNCPDQYLPANGQVLQIRQYEPLFAVIGARYGGDGRTTFALPDLREKQTQSPQTHCIAVTGIFPQRRN